MISTAKPEELRGGRGMDRTRSALRHHRAALSRGHDAPRARPAQAGNTPRRTQESRRHTARERLLAATVEVLIDRGYNGLTTKEVAARAGFSNGALVHHYKTKADLVIAATARVYDRCIENGKRIAQSDKARRYPLRAYIDDCVDVYLSWQFLAAVEVLVPARTDPALMAQVDGFMQRYRRTMNDVWLQAFTRAGIDKKEASFLMMTTLNMVRGMGINSMWQRDMPHYKKLLRRWAHAAEAGALAGQQIELR
jgi:AcrR family transcriptional regulator